ncbi:MAG: hypothetical protein EPO68_02805 [Planctomycetota bacterium]|nr:MAG: hypothetical protein EPO68_02805 [Planctomycetota bacterium]
MLAFSRSSAHSLLASLLALCALPALGAAQPGGLSWTLSSCATTSGDEMSLQVCGSCIGKLTAAFADVPVAGTVDVDVEWSTSAACCQKLEFVRLEHFTGASIGVGGLGSSTAPSWCDPAATPCSGNAHFSFDVHALDKLWIRLTSETAFCGGSTRVVVKNWSFTPSPAPSLHAATPKTSWDAGLVTLDGANFDPAMLVRVDGVDCAVVAATPTQALVQVPAGAPGWSELELSNALGSASFVHALQQRPSLETTLNPFVPALLSVRIEATSAGAYVIAWSPQTLAQPMPAWPDAWYGLLLDPAGLTVLVAGSIPASGVALIQFPIQLGGGPHAVPAQALVFSNEPPLASFTNLHVVEF